ncbi:MAG TPA: SRPBCC family protein [Mycobacteriales bacterium]|nr:SRPBCC family protein [Mycobacteriales bacterium]
MSRRPPVVLELSVDVEAPVADTWAAATDWAGQSQWMLGTTVRPTAQDGQGVGGGIEAFSGLEAGRLRLGVLDPMVVEQWQPPVLCHVRHTGRVVRGTGTFRVEAREGDRSRFVWREDLDLPLGVLGRLGWEVVRPFFAFGVQLSLRRFARWTEAGRPVHRAA